MAKKTYSEWEMYRAGITYGDFTLAWGPPGTGKTYDAYHYGVSNRADVMAVTLTDDTPTAELRGHYIPRGDQWEWQDGPALIAWDPDPDGKQGGQARGLRLVINEIDHADGSIHSFLHALLDDPDIAQLTLPNGVTVTPNDGFKVVATMNGEPGDLPPALLDRFAECVVHITSPSPEAIMSLPPDLRDPCNRSVGSNDPERRTSLRSWKAFAKMRTKVEPALAAAMVFGKNANDVLGAIQIAAAEGKNIPITSNPGDDA